MHGSDVKGFLNQGIRVSRNTAASVVPLYIQLTTDAGTFQMNIPGPLYSWEVPGCKVFNLIIGPPGPLYFDIGISPVGESTIPLQDILLYPNSINNLNELNAINNGLDMVDINMNPNNIPNSCDLRHLGRIEAITISDGFVYIPGVTGYSYQPTYMANGRLYEDGKSFLYNYPPPPVRPPSNW